MRVQLEGYSIDVVASDAVCTLASSGRGGMILVFGVKERVEERFLLAECVRLCVFDRAGVHVAADMTWHCGGSFIHSN